MMDPNEFIDLDVLHSTIVSDIQAQYPTLATVEFYRTEVRKNLPVPAILLDMVEFEFEPDLDVGTGQLAVAIRFEAEIVFGFKTPNVKQEIRKFAAAFASWLYCRRWTNISSDAAKVIGARVSDFKPELDEYEVWCVEWSQGFYLGNNAWADTSPPIAFPGYSGFEPQIGPAYVSGYVEIDAPPTPPTPT